MMVITIIQYSIRQLTKRSLLMSSPSMSLLILGGGTTTVITTAAVTVTYCSYNDNSNLDTTTKNHASEQSNSDTIAIKTSTNNFDKLNLLIPTLQSMVRISRLIGTCIAMTIDYKMIGIYEKWNKVSRNYNLFNMLQQQQRQVEDDIDDEGNNQNNKNNNNNIIKQCEYWENEIKIRQQEFNHAQDKYSTTNESERHMSIEERIHAKRIEKQQMIIAAERLAEADEQLSNLVNDNNNNDNASDGILATTTTLSTIHQRNAQRLLQLCQRNRGVYIKIGQHLANLDYLIPNEYITTLSKLYDDNPITNYNDVCQVIYEDLGQTPEQLFDSFDPIPIASASLAQVHVAYKDNKKYAIKVQHRGLRETSKGDIINLEVAVRIAEYIFPNFSLGWLADEMAPNLPKELNFINEGQNAELAAKHIQTTGLSCIIPKVHWDKTSQRVLTMDFEEGIKVTDIKGIERLGLQKRDVAKLISSIFASQVFLFGHVHCDPHEANVLVRADTNKNRYGKPIIILVDHGLYKTLDTSFRLKYAMLWKSLMLADLNGIMDACYALGITNDTSCRLFAGVLTARPFDEIVERSNKNKHNFTSSNENNSNKSKERIKKKSDHTIIRGYAQRFLPNIIALLSDLPKQVLMLLKMNDCLRHIEYTLLGTDTSIYSSRSISITGQYAAFALYLNDIQNCTSYTKKLYTSWSYFKNTIQIHINEIILWWIQNVNIVYL